MYTCPAQNADCDRGCIFLNAQNIILIMPRNRLLSETTQTSAGNTFSSFLFLGVWVGAVLVPYFPSVTVIILLLLELGTATIVLSTMLHQDHGNLARKG